jgi:H+/Cl- antiporter ClcA
LPETRVPRIFPEQFLLLRELLRWIPIAAAVGVLSGSASALLLWSLDVATRLRESHVWLIWLLAPAGALVGLMYKYLGTSVEGGNNLIFEQTHTPTETIPLRMTPLILIGTFMTHLFGGSAGREGTAIQTGASLADQLAKPLNMSAGGRRVLLMCGISAGFASVFGTPLAGAVFGLEVLAIGSLGYDAIAPCFLSAFAGDLVTRAWHIHHTVYTVGDVPGMNVRGVVYSIVAGACFGMMALVFAKLTHGISATAKRFIKDPALRPALGGAVITLVVFGVGTSRTLKYLGLGVPTIVAAFGVKLPVYDFAVKILLTAMTLGTGFKGGEVTPLFYIGATMGNALSNVIPLPTSLLAAMGFVAVFAGAANTPIASMLMAVELFGSETGAYAGIACVIAYLFSGHAGIYSSQRVGRSKHPAQASEEGLSLALVAKLRDGQEGESVDVVEDLGEVAAREEGKP